jgi:hypothetical protein
VTVKPVVIAYETDAANPGLARLRRSLDRLGWDFELVLERRWRGFGRRLKAVVERCRSLGDRYSHAVHVDSRDVVAVGPATEFVAPTVPLLLATEKAAWPRPELQSLYPPPPTPHPWKHAHSQFVVRLDRLDLLDCAHVRDNYDDQLHVTELFLRGSPEIALDYDCRYVQSIAHSNPWQADFAVEDGRVHNLKTGSLPLIVHGNGGTAMDWVPGCN